MSWWYPMSLEGLVCWCWLPHQCCSCILLEAGRLPTDYYDSRSRKAVAPSALLGRSHDNRTALAAGKLAPDKQALPRALTKVLSSTFSCNQLLLQAGTQKASSPRALTDFHQIAQQPQLLLCLAHKSTITYFDIRVCQERQLASFYC